MLKAAVLAIEGLDPILVHEWISSLPNLEKMQGGGITGLLKTPPPAGSPQSWMSLLSGKSPGATGVWDNRPRNAASWDVGWAAGIRTTKRSVRFLFEVLPAAGQRTALVDVPGTWPVPGVPGGYCVGRRPPGCGGSLTRPQDLEDQIPDLLDGHPFESWSGAGEPGSKRVDLQRIQGMDDQRLRLMSWLVDEKKCDFVMAAASGPARLLEAMEEGPERAISELRTYYKWIDGRIGELLDLLDRDTVLLVVSPYGLQPASTVVALNTYLAEAGYLVTRNRPSEPRELREADIEWAKTQCWAAGAPGCLWLNANGRYPDGCVEASEIPRIAADIRGRISSWAEEIGEELTVQSPHTAFNGPCGSRGPDLIVSSPTARVALDDRVGVTPAVSAKGRGGRAAVRTAGYMCLAGSDVPRNGKVEGLSVLSIAPTVLEMLRLRVPCDVEKPSFFKVLRTRIPREPDSGRKETREKGENHEEAAVRSRLEMLGY